MPKKLQHQCEAKNTDPVQPVPGAATRKPWPAFIEKWAARGVTVSGPDVYGCYTYTDANGDESFSFSLDLPPKARSEERVAAVLPALSESGTPSLFAGFTRRKVRDLTRAELDALDDEIYERCDLDGGFEHLSGLRYAKIIGEEIYVFEPLECRPWHDAAEKAAHAEKRNELDRKREERRLEKVRELEAIRKPWPPGQDTCNLPADFLAALDAIPEASEPAELPMRSASVIVVDWACREGAAYLEEEQIDVFA